MLSGKFPQKDSVTLFVAIKIQTSRFAEFGRAMSDRILKSRSATPPVRYCGVFTQNHKDTIAYIEDLVYTWWDQSPDAPPKSRPQDPAPAPSLSVLTWNGSSPGFPSSVVQKFPIESDEHKALMDYVNEVKNYYPQTLVGDPSSQPPGQRNNVARATGKPDFTIEGGALVHVLIANNSVVITVCCHFANYFPHALTFSHNFVYGPWRCKTHRLSARGGPQNHSSW